MTGLPSATIDLRDRGSVVTKDVEEYVLVVGNPAQQSGWICECSLELNAALACEGCRNKYRKTDGERESIAPRS